MSYATVDDVQLRAGRVAKMFEVANKRPNLADIAKLLDDVSSEVDAEFRARGYDPDAFADTTNEALRDLAAYGALYRAIAAADPSGSDQNLKNVYDVARAVWEGAMGVPGNSGSIADGSFSVIRLLEAGAGGGGPGTSAGDFWSEEPDYPTEGDFIESRLNPLLAPEVARGQKL